VPRIDPMLAIPTYWVRPPQVLSSEPGMHRFLWDMRHAPIPGAPSQYPISAVYRNTAPAASSPWAMPGKYTVRFTANGKSSTQPLMIQMDPRLKVSASDLAEQFKLSKQVYDELLSLAAISESIRSIRGQLADLRARATDNVKTHLDSFSEKLQTLGGAQGFGPGGPGGGGGGARLTVASAAGRLRTLFAILQSVDSAPTPQVTVAVPDALKDSQSLSGSWQTIKSQDIPALNQELQAAGLPAIQTEKKN